MIINTDYVHARVVTLPSVLRVCYSEELSARVEVLESTNQELERDLDDLRESDRKSVV